MNNFVTAFAGRRDSYQVPLALYEAGLLDKFIADAYMPLHLTEGISFSPNLHQKMLRRRCQALPDKYVKSKWHLAALELAGRCCAVPAKRRWAMVDRGLSRAAASHAAKTKSHLLLYEPYAWEAFTACYSHKPLRVLFHFHPHPLLENEILSSDSVKYPPSTGKWMSFDGGLSQQTHSQECWQHADLILCASSFTRHSLIHAGANPAKCSVIPYGIEVPTDYIPDRPGNSDFQILFVGTGLQRKGLHHLLTAWKLAALPQTAGLTMVCREIDPQMWALIKEAGTNVKLLKGVTSLQLKRLYQKSHLLVVPSLVEGFGFVFLEAMASGCPVLGTKSTCLPDLGGESDGVFLVGAGNPTELAQRLKRLFVDSPQLLDVRRNAMQCARRFTWQRFRHQLIENLKSLERSNIN
jgi:glycosyltransferase involved in cell wall biosynthesis